MGLGSTLSCLLAALLEPAQVTSDPFDPDSFFGARVLDATTSRPIEGVRVEAWTENFDDDPLLVAETTTVRSGGFRLPRFLDKQRADKLRLSAPGYRSTVVHAGEAELFLFPRGGPFAVRVLGLDGRPVAGARVRTHQTCAHAPPAAQGETDAEGRVVFTDFPALSQGAEVEILAPGHGALQYLSHEHLLARNPAEATVHLPLRSPLRVRCLDEKGLPLAGRRVVLGLSPEWQASRTDANGLVEFASTFESRYARLELREGGEAHFLAEGWPPREGTWTVRLGGERLEAESHPGELATLVVSVQREPLIGDETPVVVRHARGWVFLGAGEHRLPAGMVEIVYGTPFGDVLKDARTLSLEPEERREVVFTPRPAPRIRLATPPDRFIRVHVQAGEDSITREWRSAGTIEFAVPALVPVVLLAEEYGPDFAATRRIELASIEKTLELAWTDLETVEQRDWSDFELAFDPVDASGEPIPDVHMGVWAIRSASVDESSLCVRASGPCEVKLRANGFVPRWVSEAGGLDGPTRTRVRLVARASLRVEGSFARGVACGLDGERADRALVWEDLAPGPVDLSVERPDGSRIDLQLELAEGEKRVVQLR